MHSLLTNWKQYLRLAFTGFSMGAADIVPGVSGGTIAFIFGIYEELIQSIKTLSGETLQHLSKGKIREAWNSVPFGFLIPLAVGLGGAVMLLSSVLEYLLAEQPVFLWSFFFGLVVASVVLVSRRIVSWDLQDFAVGALATIAAYYIVGMVPVETSSHPIAFFLAGFVAICAMILPGISGSFLLLIMGKYEQILSAVNTFDVVILGLVAAGAVIGLAIFSRVLSWLFAKHHDVVIAILTGFMIGSLRKIWPWKEVLESRVNSHGALEALVTRNVLPESVDLTVVIALALATLGMVLIFVLSKWNVTDEVVSDLDDPQFEKAHAKSVKSQKHS